MCASVVNIFSRLAVELYSFGQYPQAANMYIRKPFSSLSVSIMKTDGSSSVIGIWWNELHILPFGRFESR